ncbi:MAG TPA: type VI secretion system baseplate subunit TssK [Longimicrobium sp.]
MRGLETVPDDVMWEEGMLLAPQHFQQASIRGEELLHYHVRAAAPWHWGVRELDIDLTNLPAGLFRVTRLEAVMPDGLPVRRGRGEEAALELQLGPFAEQARPGAPLTVWLALPARRSPGEPFAGSLPRYEPSGEEEVVDELTGVAHPVRRLRPRLQLKAGPVPSDAFVAFPLARVVFSDEEFHLADYEPPRLAAAPGRFPHNECAALAERVRNKAGALAERGDDLERTDAEVRALAAGLPQLEAVLDAGECHPFQLYLAACALAGHLAGAAPRLVPPPFRAYEHNELRATFAPVLAFADSVLSRVSETLVPRRFTLNERGEFELRDVEEEWLREGVLVVGVTAPAGAPEGEVLDWMVKEALIGSAAQMPSIQGRRFKGAEREPIRDPRGVGLNPGRREVLFRVKVDRALIAPKEPLVIANPGDPAGSRRPREVVLYTRKAS